MHTANAFMSVLAVQLPELNKSTVFTSILYYPEDSFIAAWPSRAKPPYYDSELIKAFHEPSSYVLSSSGAAGSVKKSCIGIKLGPLYEAAAFSGSNREACTRSIIIVILPFPSFRDLKTNINNTDCISQSRKWSENTVCLLLSSTWTIVLVWLLFWQMR